MFKSLDGNYNKCFEIKSGSVYINVSLCITKEKKSPIQKNLKNPLDVIED